MLNTETRTSAWTYAFGGLAFLATAIEVIIALKFNLLRYPTIPLGVTDVTWARALTIFAFAGFAFFAWRNSREEPLSRITVFLTASALVMLITDALVGFSFNASVAEEGEVPLHPSVLPVGELAVRVVPFVSMVLALLGLTFMQSFGKEGLMGRLTVVGGLAMGLTGMLAVLPALPYSAIGFGDFTIRELFGDVNRVFKSSFRVGPASPSEVYYAGMFILAALITVASMGRSDEDIDKTGAKMNWLRVVDWVALILLGWACFMYVYVGIEKMTFSTLDAHASLIGCLAVLYLCYRVFGLALALFGAVSLLYFFVSSFMPGIFKAEFGGYRSIADNLWFNNSKAVLGSKLGILLNNVLPFIIFGSLLSATGAAKSLITIAFFLMRRTRGGPAHAAVLASGLFGSVSGSAVSNVVGTGVITIPMIKKRGYAPSFAGGVEATASTGGQIMPPIMGAAALVMADLTGTAYLDIMIAALIPALAYYLSLFVTVVFESRRMDMQVQSLDELDPVTRQDYINVILLVLLPLFIVIWRLVQGASPAGSALTAIVAILLLSAFSPTVRQQPALLLKAIGQGGVTFGRLLMVVGVVGIIVAVMNTTDLPSKLGREITEFASIALVLTLIITAVVSLLVGMGMPTLPAYLTVIIILGPALNSLGLSLMTSHMFVFYFGVASAITPPVAVAAFAAAAIAGAPAIQTGIAAVRIGVVIFAVPFMFAFNPDMMIVQAAFDTDGRTFSLAGFASAILRTALMIYLLASATSRFDQSRLSWPEAGLRFGLAVLLISPTFMIHAGGAVAALLLIGGHWLVFSRRAGAQA